MDSAAEIPMVTAIVNAYRDEPWQEQSVKAALVASEAGGVDLVHLFCDDLLPGNYEAPRSRPKFNPILRAYWRAVERRLAT